MRSLRPNNLLHLEHQGRLISAIVDHVEKPKGAPHLPVVTLSSTEALHQGDRCVWVTECGKRRSVQVEQTMVDWGLTTARVRLLEW